MADFPRTADDTVAIGGDSLAVSQTIQRYAIDLPTAWNAQHAEDFSGDLSAYTGNTGLTISSGYLTAPVGDWYDMALATDYVVGMPVVIEFDFWVPASSAYPAEYYAYEVDGDGVYLYIDNAASDLTSWGAYAGFSELKFVPDPSSWYRGKMWAAGRTTGSTMAVKVWKVGDPEPDWQLVTGKLGTSSPSDNNYFAIEVSGTASEPGRMDNVLISGEGATSDEILKYPLEWRMVGRFNIGAASSRLSRPFTIDAPSASSLSSRRFQIAGSVGSTSVRTFLIDGALKSTSQRIFDIETASTQSSGDDLGAFVTPTNLVSTTLAADAAIGATSIVVTSSTGITAGMLFQIGDGNVIAVSSVVGTTVNLSAPLTVAVLTGAVVSTARGFVPGIHVFDKAGIPLGVVTRYTMTTTPSMMIGSIGSAGFYVPRTSPQALMLSPDRLIAFQFRQGSGEMWAGTIEVSESATSVIRVTAPDALSLLTGAPIVIEEKPSAAVPASTVYNKIVVKTNEQKVRDSEITWSFSDHGATNLFFGSLDWDDDALEAIEDVATRSDTEFRYVASIDPATGRLQLALRASNKFSYASTVPIADGIGGNVASNPRWVRDSAPIRNGIRVTGIASAIGEYLPDWAQWAAGDVSPEAEVLVDPGDKRRRVDRRLSLGFGISPVLLKSIANQILAELWNMYRSFVYAWHDQTGKPYHPGWGYEGPPSNIEPFLHTGLGWRTRSRLVQLVGQPASVVMYSEPEKQVLAVTYDRVTSEYKVRRYWGSEQEGTLYVPRMRLHGYALHFASEGGVLTRKRWTAYDHTTGVIMSANAVTMPYRYTDDDGVEQTEWYTVRRMTELTEDNQFAVYGEGEWFVMQQPRGPTSGVCTAIRDGKEVRVECSEPDAEDIFTRATVGDPPFMIIDMVPAPHNIDFDSGFITTLYEAERGNIRNWDPRRDGVGVYMNKTSVYNNAPTTRARWHIVPFGVGVDGTTTLVHGVAAADTKLYVDSVFSLPRLGSDWDGMAELGADPVMEMVKVISIVGNELTVQRGQQGTTAIIHEASTSLKALNVTESSLFEHLWKNLDWVEGRTWAERVLEKLKQEFVRVSVEVTNRDATWAAIKLGSLHTITLTTEGAELLTGQVRTLGMSPDAMTGRMEVVFEWQP